MIEPLLKRRLEPAVRKFRRQRILLRLLLGWTAGALALGALLLGSQTLGTTLPRQAWVITVASCAAVAAIIWYLARQWQPDYRSIARTIEQQHPELHALLLTAVEQRPDPQTGRYNYLQQRVIQEAVAESFIAKWVNAVPARRMALLQFGHWAALGCFVALALATLALPPAQLRKFGIGQSVEISPGDTVLERGTPLVVLARFGGRVPAEATLLVDAQGEAGQRISLVKNLEDPTFGGTVPMVNGDLIYSVNYDGKETARYTVRVFDYPRLEQADAHVVFPEYTGRSAVEIKDTRRVSAVEGSQLDWTLRLNKPVSSARLVAKDNTTVPLHVVTNEGRATLSDFVLKQTKIYQLQLVDEEGRTNKMPAQFVFEALTNRRPEIKLASPRGDQRLSSLEEIGFGGQVWDDFGLKDYGMTYTLAGKEPQSFSLGDAVPGTEKRSFEHLLKLESLGVVPDQLVSWFVWADDTGPDGNIRRTSSDMYFAEIRPFEEIFRQGDGMEGSMQGQQGGGAGNESMKLAELQKQIISATWKLQRREHGNPLPPQYTKDTSVVLESQEQALEQARTLKARALDPRLQSFWDTVEEEMTKAVEQLTSATNKPEALPAALSAEQSAYQGLLRIAGGEFLVTRNSNRNRSQGGGGGEQRNQRQLDQLEFKGEDNRYETQSQASPAQSAEQREQLGVLSRLKELAQRQQDMNERLKELQTALQEAKTEKEREELKRELKRLREEEQDLLANVDELLQRMSQPQNQSPMAEARRELEKTRDDVQRAAEALNRESVSEALTSGTRAERELEELRDDFRKKGSSQFAEDMRQMRNEARELARNQQEIGEKMNAESERKSLSDSDDTKALADKLQGQQSAITNLLQNMQRVSEQAEVPEPLLAKQLYDALRRANQDDASRAKQALADAAREGTMTRSLYDRLREIDKESKAKSIEATAELLRNNLMPQARSAEQRARADIDNLKRGLERAAESVIGDDTEALQMAQNELDDLARQLEGEMARQTASTNSQLGGANTNGTQFGEASSREPGGTNSQAAGTSNTQSTNASAGAQARTGSPRQGDSAQANAGQQPPGENQGQGGQQPSQSGQAQAQSQSGQQGQSGQQAQNGQGQGQSEQASSSPGEGGGQGQNPANRPTTRAQAGGQDQQNDSTVQAGENAGGPFRLRQQLQDFLNSGRRDGGGGGGPNDNEGPLTGASFQNWSERLGNVEEMVENPELRSDIARIRDRARNIRTELKKHAKSPQWPLVQSQIISPLHEVRTRVAEELARRQSTEALVPIDRDPVPNKFSELVRRYYEKLGQD